MSNGFRMLHTTTTTPMYNRIQINATVRINYFSVVEKQPVSYAGRTVCAAGVMRLNIHPGHAVHAGHCLQSYPQAR
jgi:V8-like Glu-specific endopeptidase